MSIRLTPFFLLVIIKSQVGNEQHNCRKHNLGDYLPRQPQNLVARSAMELLEKRILKEGKVYPGEVLKVGGFLNHLIDDSLLQEIGKEIGALYRDTNVNKIITIEASGIAIACYTAMQLHVPVLFAKKTKTSNVSSNLYSAEVTSYTHQNTNTIVVEKEYLTSNDRVLITDDFLAHGEALRGLISLVKQAGATLVGCAVAIEKGFQGGGDKLRA